MNVGSFESRPERRAKTASRGSYSNTGIVSLLPYLHITLQFPPLSLERLFLIAFTITQCVEVPVAVCMTRWVFRMQGMSLMRVALVVFFASALTRPCLWFLLPVLLSPQWYSVIGECVVILMEAFVYRAFLYRDARKSFLLSLTANVLSILAGKLLLG